MDAGWLDHGYAITGHKAQGVTVDHTFVLGSDALYREWGYVAMSRGRESNHLYVHARAELIDGGPHLDSRGHPLAESSARLSRLKAETSLTSAVVVPLAPPDWADGDRAAEPPIGERLHDARTFLLSPPVRERRRIEGERVQAESRIAWCETARATMVAELDSSGIAVTPAARRVKRSRRERVDTLSDEIAGLETRLAALASSLSRLPDAAAIEQATAVERSLTDQLHVGADAAVAAVAAARRAMPGYLLRTLGTRPAEPTHQRAWDDAVRAIERYRLAWNVSDPDRPLGAAAQQPAQRHDHEWALLAITQANAAQDRVATRGQSRARAR